MVSSKKALLAGVLASVVLAQRAFGAEKDGVFVGVELGANKVKFKQDLTMSQQGVGTLLSGDIKADNLMPSLAVKGGYKWFFGAQRKFGVRAYGQVGVGHGRLVNVEYDMSGAGAVGLQQPGVTDSVFHRHKRHLLHDFYRLLCRG